MSTEPSSTSFPPAADPLVPDEQEVRAIVDRARAGDRDALGRLYDLYLTPVYRFVLGHVGNVGEAEDITAEVFLRVIEHIRRFEWQDVPFTAWLFRIARNQVISHHRKHGPHRVNGFPENFDVEDGRPGPEWQVEYRLTADEVYRACARLAKAQREVIALRFGAGLSVRETAEALGKSENSVKVLQHKAIARLQKLLGVG